MTFSLEKFDVIVVGAGPGGSAAAMKCAQNGFRTLILAEIRDFKKIVMCYQQVTC